MKKLFVLLVVFLFAHSFIVLAAEKEIESRISKVTVFMNGAQVSGDYKISLPAGTTTLKFTGISSYVDKNSIRVTGQGSFTILSVKQSLNYVDDLVEQNKGRDLENEIRQYKLQKETKETELKVLQERKDFLVANLSIVGSDKVIEPGNLKLYSDFFAAGFSDVEMKMLATQRDLKDIDEKIRALELQSQELMKDQDRPSAEILVEIDAKQETTGNFNLSYLVTNAGWYPTYDLRVQDIDHPVELTYQANVYQATGIDWKNVDLIISNADPAENANIPALFPYYLNFAQTGLKAPTPNTYDPGIREVRGKVVDAETGEPLPFVSVIVKDRSVGAATDFDGNFSISIPVGAQYLQFSFVGYVSQVVPVSQAYIMVYLNPDVVGLQAMEVTSYAISKDSYRSSRKEDEEISIPLEVKTSARQTGFEFNIQMPYTIESNANALKIDMKRIDLASDYIYKSVPKLAEKAFLIALIRDWEQHDLLVGEINLYYANTYVGKSLLDLSQMKDTLEVSLGPDRSISVKREQEKEFSSKQFLGSNKMENRHWKTTIKNNKSQAVRLLVYDQVPVSNNAEITVETINYSQGTLVAETGQVTWELELAPGETITRSLEYSVKYPKSRMLRIQ